MTDGFEAALTRAAALRRIRSVFEHHAIAAAGNEARFLIEHALVLSPLDLTLRGDLPIGPEGADRLSGLVRRRLAGEPLARLIGAWEFWGLPFRLSPATLVPRPDTETLVETALALAGARERKLRVLDLGTGSGCILVAVLSELPAARGVGLDLSFEALATARFNARANGVGARAAFMRGAWCASLNGPFDLILSNPPYIARAVIPTLAPEVRDHDPVLALDGGADGLDAYRAIIGGAGRILAPQGALALEVGYDQADAVVQLGREAGFAGAEIARDLAGHARVVTLRPPLTGREHGQDA